MGIVLSVVTEQGTVLLTERRWVYIAHKEEIFDDEGNKMLEQLTQIPCGCITGSVEDQVEGGFKQSDLVKGIPVLSTWIGLDGL